MATVKQLAEFAILSVAMPAALGLGLWGSVELLSLAGIVQAPVHVPIPPPPPPGSPIDQTGRIDKLEPEGKIILQHLQNGRAGAVIVVDQYNILDGLPLGDLKTGDNVSFTAARVEGQWTVTKIQKQ